MAWAVGIDLGGTNVRAARVAEDGAVQGFLMRAVDRGQDGEGHVRSLARLVEEVAAGEKLAGVGVAVPATVRSPGGEILPGTSNLKGLEGFPLARRMEEATGYPCAIGNDADLVMWGEARFGAAKSARNAIALTLGTGIGSGLMLGGRLWEGSHGFGAEIGLTLVPRLTDREPRRWVALEELVSAEALRRWAGGSAEEIFSRAGTDDPAASKAADTVCEYLAVAITNAHLLLNLDLALLCGGMAKAGERLLEGVKRKFSSLCLPAYQHGLTIGLGQLGDRAGILGAASLALMPSKRDV